MGKQSIDIIQYWSGWEIKKNDTIVDDIRPRWWKENANIFTFAYETVQFHLVRCVYSKLLVFIAKNFKIESKKRGANLNKKWFERIITNLTVFNILIRKCAQSNVSIENKSLQFQPMWYLRCAVASIALIAVIRCQIVSIVIWASISFCHWIFCNFSINNWIELIHR